MGRRHTRRQISKRELMEARRVRFVVGDDAVAVARPHLIDPSFTMKAAAWYGARAIACPPQYRAGRDQLFRNSERDREELTELKLKAKPKTHATTWKQAAE